MQPSDKTSATASDWPDNHHNVAFHNQPYFSILLQRLPSFGSILTMIQGPFFYISNALKQFPPPNEGLGHDDMIADRFS